MIGIYIRGLKQSIHGTPKQAAKKAKDHGVNFVAIMACWQDIRGGKPSMLHSNGRDGKLIAQYAEAFAAVGISPWIWGYPWAGREELYVERLKHVTEVCDGSISGWLHDPEIGYKWGKNFQYRREHVIRRAGILVHLCSSWRLSQGVTSYGMARGHRNFPWSILGGWGFGSPQLYTTPAADIDRGIAQWRDRGWSHIVPSVPLFGRNSGAHLHDHLSNFVDGNEDIAGLVFWSWRQASLDEWRIIERWSRWLDAGMCVAA